MFGSRDSDGAAAVAGLKGLGGGLAESILGNVMDNFENTMMSETKKFEAMMRDIDLKQKASEKEEYSEHVPLTLRNEGADLETLWRRVQGLFYDPQADENSLNMKATLRERSTEFYQMILSHGMGAWLSTLSQTHIESLRLKIYDETSQWISKLWRFRCSSSLFHNKLYDGILTVCKVALRTQYPTYETEGYTALYSQPPVIYLNNSVDPVLMQYLRINLGLPSNSITSVPNNLELGGDESMDIMALEQLISADSSAGKMPLVICAYAGSPTIGSMDKLHDLHNLCQKHRIWLHIEGFRLSQLTFLHVPAKVSSISSRVKSMTLDLGSWLGIPSVPFITLVMSNVTDSYMQILGFGSGYFMNNRTSMDLFPLWFSLQLLGHDGIINKLDNQTKLNCTMVKRIREITNIKLLSRVNQVSKTSKNTDDNIKTTEMSKVKGFMDTVLTYLLDGHQVPFVIVFRYDPQGQRNEESGDRQRLRNGSVSSSCDKVIRKPRFVATGSEESHSYLNSLNQWLAGNIIAEYPQMNLALVTLPLEGLCLRVCVQENDICQDISEELLEKFFKSLDQHVAVMNATVNQRHIFKDIVKTKPQLIYIDLPGWAGLGCVLFIPEVYQVAVYNLLNEEEAPFNNHDFIHFLTNPQHVRDMNKINKMVIDELRNDDEAFSFGLYHWTLSEDLNELEVKDPRTLVCVRFGLITESTLVEELIDLVINKGEYVEASARNLEKLSQLVKEGIDKVTEELAKEHEEQLRQGGVLRQVPYIDSIINWWYPSSKSEIKGRSLNLSSGEIQLTDDTYKYKMQLMAGPQSVFSFNKDVTNKDSDP